MKSRDMLLQPGKFFADETAKRPVNELDSWCHLDDDASKWGIVVTIPSVPKHDIVFPNLDGHVIRSATDGENLLLQVIPFDKPQRSKIRVFVAPENFPHDFDSDEDPNVGPEFVSQMRKVDAWFSSDLARFQRQLQVENDFTMVPAFEYEDAQELKEYYNPIYWRYVVTFTFLPRYDVDGYGQTDCTRKWLLHAIPCYLPLHYGIRVRERKLAIDRRIVSRIQKIDVNRGTAFVRKVLEEDPDVDFAHAPGYVRRLSKRDLEFIRRMLEVDPDYIRAPYVVRQIRNVVNLRKSR